MSCRGLPRLVRTTSVYFAPCEFQSERRPRGTLLFTAASCAFVIKTHDRPSGLWSGA